MEISGQSFVQAIGNIDSPRVGLQYNLNNELTDSSIMLAFDQQPVFQFKSASLQSFKLLTGYDSKYLTQHFLIVVLQLTNKFHSYFLHVRSKASRRAI